MEILKIENLTFYYPETNIPVLDKLSLSVGAGDFFILCGRSGCGKSTLLRNIKPQLKPHGILKGNVFFDGKPIAELSDRDAAAKIGFVMQSPDDQIVTDKVWHELAFGLENLGYDTPTIRRRAAETAAFFGLEGWFYKNVDELSGGQKQLLNLASIMVMQPELLILDEPTSSLDPIAAADFFSVLTRINRELGVTVIMTEHRLEEALPLATRAAVMERGRISFCGDAANIGKALKANDCEMFSSMPAAMRIWGSVNTNLECPVSVSEGRKFLSEYVDGSENMELNPVPQSKPRVLGKTLIEADDAWFRYEKGQADVLRGATVSARAGEHLCILGGNGAGKSTTLKILSGLYKPYRGRVKREGRVCLLPQNPQTLFEKKTVAEDIEAAGALSDVPKDERKNRIQDIISLCRLRGLENRHPYDLSGGEMQRAALAKLLLLNPDVLLLDEPTKGMDAVFKEEFAGIIEKLLDRGTCVITVSHDVEFCARRADRCALFFDGSIVSEGTPREFFLDNNFYTTSAARIARGIIPGAVVAEDVIQAIGGEITELVEHSLPSGDVYNKFADNVEALQNEKKLKPLPLWRRFCGISFIAISIYIFVYSLKTEKLSQMIDSGGINDRGADQLIIYGALILSLIFATVFLSRKSFQTAFAQEPRERRKLSRRTAASAALVLLAVPITLFVGIVYIDRKQYYITALLILVECMIPFFMIFEGRRPKARELAIVSTLCALAIAGRAAFFMLPQFKPVLAMTIISGVAFGGETGFLVGSVTMLVSNILFSQGPWTPWQMFAMGIIGFIAGVLYRKGWIRRTRTSLCIFGIVCAILIYGGIMNPTSALIWGGGSLTPRILAAYYIAGFPMDCVHGASTAMFLWFIAEPMLEKLDRIKVKYGLIE